MGFLFGGGNYFFIKQKKKRFFCFNMGGSPPPPPPALLWKCISCSKHYFSLVAKLKYVSCCRQPMIVTKHVRSNRGSYFLEKSKQTIYILCFFFWLKKLLMQFLSLCWLSMYFYQVMCAIILLVLEPYLQVTLCSVYHAESFLKGLHSRFVFTGLQMLPYSCILL